MKNVCGSPFIFPYSGGIWQRVFGRALREKKSDSMPE